MTEENKGNDLLFLRLEPGFVITAPALVVDRNGIPWWIYPETRRAEPVAPWRRPE